MSGLGGLREEQENRGPFLDQVIRVLQQGAMHMQEVPGPLLNVTSGLLDGRSVDGELQALLVHATPNQILARQNWHSG